MILDEMIRMGQDQATGNDYDIASASRAQLQKKMSNSPLSLKTRNPRSNASSTGLFSCLNCFSSNKGGIPGAQRHDGSSQHRPTSSG